MKFIHIADIHASRERLPQTLSILNTLTERAKKGDIDFIIFAGDFWDSTITATKGSGFSDIITAIRELEKQTYLYFLYGTPSHEPNGSLDAFASEKTKIIYNNRFDIFIGNDKYTDIYFIPEPRRSNYIGKSAEEINNAINSDISDFIKFAQSKRKIYSRIVVYHGEVKGAVYQNGVSASSPTAISKELLQSLHADYYALGHIHMPQEIFPNAWYPGSACPKNFGEPHDGHYNLVTIENGKTEVEQVSFGLPCYVTFYERPDDFIEGNKGSLKNMNIRFIFDCSKEERKQMNLKALIDETKNRLNCTSVKIETNTIETECTERSEVSKRKSIVDKLDEYVKEKALILPKYTRELLQNIQDNTLSKLAFPQHSFELLYISLRGAIGIRDGQHKEEIECNFEQYEDGVICLVGHTGAGKSTLVENCHPYPKMLSREGTLKEHFYLKDSHRILIYKDENGLYYKISMLIDGKTSTGKVSYYVETSKDREVWKSVPDVDGSLETYKTWVNNTFGSVDVYLRTAFFAKEQTKDAADISATTKSERMELLSKLAGTEYLKEVSAIAKEQRKEVEKNVDKIEAEIESYSECENDLEQNNKDIEIWKENIKEQELLIANTEKQVVDLRVKNLEYQKEKAVNEANKNLYKQYEKEYNTLRPEFDILDNAVNNSMLFDKVDSCHKVIATNAPLIESAMKHIEELDEKIKSSTESVLQQTKAESEDKSNISILESDIKFYKSQIVEVEDVCPTCGQKISQHKIDELNAHVKENEKSLRETELKLLSEKESLLKIQNSIKSIEEQRETLLSEKASVESDLADLQSESASCNDFLENLDEVYTKYTYADVVEKHLELSKTIQDLQTKMSEISSSVNAEDVSDELAVAETNLQMYQLGLNDLNSSIKAAKRENEKISKKLAVVDDKKKELKDLKAKVTAYLFIEDAFSNKGIPAIELRESAPEIADIANKILNDSYGNKFTIRFGSTSEVRTKHKSDEDFNILVYDNDNNDEKTIDLVSSGERILIKQALFYAFSIVQMERTGFNFRTRLIDESDGSLDGSLRPKYLRMIESAHKNSDARITIFITHSQEVKDIAQQIIEM